MRCGELPTINGVGIIVRGPCALKPSAPAARARRRLLVSSIFDYDLHAKRVDSLADTTVGALQGARLGQVPLRV